MNKGIKYLVVGVLAAATAMSVRAANIEIDWSASDYTGFALQNGTPVPDNAYASVGYFSTAPTAGSSDLSAYHAFASSTAVFNTGSVSGYPGFIPEEISSYDQGAFGGQQLYFVITSGTQEGIYTFSPTQNANWKFPHAGDIPNSSSPDIEQLVDLPGTAGNVLNGNATVIYGSGPQYSAGSSYMLLQDTVVPEPSTWVLVGTGLLGLIGLARRRS
ncbi:MAG: PEP-CTERM sorting domain-containing protein [Verrucomicrobiia bacterium]|jgi:hypothetical protein